MERRALPGQILREDKMRKNILYAKRDCENGKRLARLLERAKLKFEKESWRAVKPYHSSRPWASAPSPLLSW